MHTPPADPATISFGLSLEEDRHSCATYLRLLGRSEFAELFSSRLTSEEIDALVDLTTQLMRAHLSEQEYHREFLGSG
jgi:hypothetical protein